MKRGLASLHRAVGIALAMGVSFLSPSLIPAQCAMCGAAAASSKGVARGIAFSVYFLLGTLALVVGWLVVLVLRSQAGTSPTGEKPAPGEK
jgi:Na+/proline symporter